MLVDGGGCGPVLALGMCVLGLVVDPPVLSFLCLLATFVCWPFPLFCLFAPYFGFVVSLGLSRPVGSAGVGGHRWWTGIEEDVLCLFFFCYSWPLGHREASKRVLLEFT